MATVLSLSVCVITVASLLTEADAARSVRASGPARAVYFAPSLATADQSESRSAPEGISSAANSPAGERQPLTPTKAAAFQLHQRQQVPRPALAPIPSAPKLGRKHKANGTPRVSPPPPPPALAPLPGDVMAGPDRWTIIIAAMSVTVLVAFLFLLSFRNMLQQLSVAVDAPDGSLDLIQEARERERRDRELREARARQERQRRGEGDKTPKGLDSKLISALPRASVVVKEGGKVVLEFERGEGGIAETVIDLGSEEEGSCFSLSPGPEHGFFLEEKQTGRKSLHSLTREGEGESEAKSEEGFSRSPGGDSPVDLVLVHPSQGMCAEECAVCLSEYSEGDEVRWLPDCRHAFHEECIRLWLTDKKTCPVCRTEVGPALESLGQASDS